MCTTEKYLIDGQIYNLPADIIADLTGRGSTSGCPGVLCVHSSLHSQQLSEDLLLPGAADHRAEPIPHQKQWGSPVDAFLKYILLLSKGFKSLVISSCAFEPLGEAAVPSKNGSHTGWGMCQTETPAQQFPQIIRGWKIVWASYGFPDNPSILPPM